MVFMNCLFSSAVGIFDICQGTGLLSAPVPLGMVIMGVGGGFIMVPAMIYLLNMPTKVVVGTSLFQIIFVSAFTTLMHAVTNQTVDFVLAVVLLAVVLLAGELTGRVPCRGAACLAKHPKCHINNIFYILSPQLTAMIIVS